jgi:hypothetical protein
VEEERKRERPGGRQPAGGGSRRRPEPDGWRAGARGSTIVTSNRAIEEWIPLFDDPILAQSALDRLAHNAYQVVMEGESYRSRQRPGMAKPALPPKRRK